MSFKTIFTCDRCGTKTEIPNAQDTDIGAGIGLLKFKLQGPVTVQAGSYVIVDYVQEKRDLCEPCGQKLMDWMESK